ncbi:hypothetical protein SB861_61135, partial [Paraburkholderia sp. SIMBA_049]
LVANGGDAGHCTGRVAPTRAPGVALRQPAVRAAAGTRDAAVFGCAAAPTGDSMRAARVSGRTAKPGRLSRFATTIQNEETPMMAPKDLLL